MELLELAPHDDGQVVAPFVAILGEDMFGNRVRFLPERRTREVWRDGGRSGSELGHSPSRVGLTRACPRTDPFLKAHLAVCA